MRLGDREIEYILGIYRYTVEQRRERIGTNMLASIMGVSPPTVVEMCDKLAGKGLINYVKRKGICLTKLGIEVAKELIWRHRVVESFLYKNLGLDADVVCNHLSGAEYRIGRDIVERMYEVMGRPSRCPHGELIPKVVYR